MSLRTVEYLSRVKLLAREGYFDSFIAEIRSLDDAAVEYFSKRLSKVGISEKRGFFKSILPTFIFSIIDSLAPYLRLTTSRIVKEYSSLVDVMGDPEEDFANYMCAEEIETALDTLKWLSRLGDFKKIALSKAISVISEVLYSKGSVLSNIQSLADALSKKVLDDLSAIYNYFEINKKSLIIGLLLKTKCSGNRSHIEVLRLSLLALPGIDQRTANLFLYYLAKVLFRDEASLSSLHVPIDPHVARPAIRVGIVSKLPSNPKYASSRYREFQTVAKVLFPDDPTALYALKLVGLKFCKHKPACDLCPLFFNCDYALTSPE